ncbi:proclotting enzyme-like [Montipora foliosa]|uniref:proclotting enzyme-like n=1 Tax=Montipora foliosa TaxID=591990 RepID=UPI0035F1851C
MAQIIRMMLFFVILSLLCRRLVTVPACPPPPQPANAVILRTSTHKYDGVKRPIVLYSCKQGYLPRGERLVSCLGREWSEVKFFCVQSKNCSWPRKPKHGKRIGNDFSVGQKVWYICDGGFEIKGSVTLQCLENRTWSGPVPICKAVDCGSLQDPLNGKKMKETKTTFGGQAEFVCASKRYTLTGSKRRFCRSNGKWSGKPAICKAPCSNPGIPRKGKRIGNNFRHGRTVSFSCPQTRKMIGPKRITCFDGNWTNKKPQCLLPTQVKDYSQCGIRRRVRRPRMVGGLPSSHGMWPWQVGLYRRDRSQGKDTFICGGALIDKLWILTAAHCFMYTDADENARRPLVSPSNMYTVVIGDSHRNKTESSQHTFIAAKIILHPHYHDDFKTNDVALVKVSSSVTLGNHVRKVCLPEYSTDVTHQDDVIPGRKGHVAGWGATQLLKPGELLTQDPDKLSSSELRSAQFQIQDMERCRNSTDYWFNESVSFCAGSEKRGSGICKGDSGSPFVMNVMHNGARKWVAIGLVSWGEGCGIHGYYTFYTKLAPYLEWINKQIKKKPTEK